MELKHGEITEKQLGVLVAARETTRVPITKCPKCGAGWAILLGGSQNVWPLFDASCDCDDPRGDGCVRSMLPSEAVRMLNELPDTREAREAMDKLNVAYHAEKARQDEELCRSLVAGQAARVSWDSLYSRAKKRAGSQLEPGDHVVAYGRVELHRHRLAGPQINQQVLVVRGTQLLEVWLLPHTVQDC